MYMNKGHPGNCFCEEAGSFSNDTPRSASDSQFRRMALGEKKDDSC